MRVLLLMRGAMGCGKSTFIEQNGLKPYTLCADDIRLLCQAPVLGTDGNYCISQKNEKVVWQTLFNILEVRMKRGEFTVIDATNTKTSEMNRYKDLAKKYRYRIYCVDMTDVPIGVAKERNKKRDPIKYVPEEAIDRAYARFATQKIPSGIKAIKPNELDTIFYRPIDLSEYDKVHVIGDIHGCYTALMEFMNNHDVNANDFFIFLGDYLDRGLENVQTLEYLLDLWENHKNVYFLEGNHEAHLRNWANDEDIMSPEFRNHTMPKLEQAGIDKKRVRQFCRSFGQCSYFIFHGMNVLVTHGGLSTMPKNLTFIATEQMIKGVGDYKDANIVDGAFYTSTEDGYYSVHGHRNETHEPLQVNPTTFNLNGDVEFGGDLRAVTFRHEKWLDKSFIDQWEIPNSVYKIPEDVTKNNDEISNAEVHDVIEYMRASKYIGEKSFGNISSFNFTRGAFQDKVWDGMTTKARGLYIDTEREQVVARGYEKFFNYGEMEFTKPEALARNLKFPVEAYVKENGFLGIVSTDNDGELIFTSKSAMGGDHAVMVKENLYNIYGATAIEKMREYANQYHVTFVFEIIDRERDPHIIQYNNNYAILLDIINNSMKFDKLPYGSLKYVAKDIGLEYKQHYKTLNNVKELNAFIDKATDPKFRLKTDRIDDDCIEGFVFEDADGFMFKLKVSYYNDWKMLRSVANKIFRSGNINFTGALQSIESNYFYGWCRDKFIELDKQGRWAYSKRDIIDLRDEFRTDMKAKGIEYDR